ncbi:DUF975 family protein [Candidatus Parcubacteria bacterium]|nr:DUF975 family protein [Candidatus Parcubacteria bacterium]
MNTLFSKKDVLTEAWHKVKAHFWFLFLTMVGVLVVTGAAGWFPPLSAIVGIFVSVSILTASLMLADGMSPTFKDLFRKYHHWRLFLNYFLATLLSIVIIAAGLILFVIPGIYFAFRIQFYKFLVVDKEDIGPWMAIKESWRMTEGHVWNLFLFTLLIVLINLLGFILFGIGLFVSVPVSIVAYSIIYRKLLANISLAAA